jgi:PKD repeat protein
MANPNFNISSDNVLYTNALTPFSADPLSSDIYSKSYYLWDFGDGNTSPLSSASHVYTEAGIYDVTMSQYLSSGDIVSSESQTITAHNLIPNLMKWAGDSYASSSIVASVKNSIPFKAEVYNSYQTYDENGFLTFYVENSNSIPFDITDKRIHLKPTWRFVDVNENVIDTVSLTHTKLYAQMVNGEIKIGEGLNPSESVFVGTSSTAEFYFIDDTPSGIDVDESSYLPSTIIVSQPLTSKYGDVKFGNENYIQYPNLINSVFVDNVTPY